MAGNTINQNGLIWPSRRKFIQRAPLLFGGLALASIAKPAKALSMFGAGVNLGGDPSQPSIAASAGYNSNVFYDDFTSIGSIDVNNTLSPGYKWYMSPYSGISNIAPTLQSSGISVANSILTLTGTSTSADPNGKRGNDISPLGYVNSNQWVGTSFAPTGGYFEAQMSWANNEPNINPRPYATAFWMYNSLLSRLISVNGFSAAGAGTFYGEIDFLESYSFIGQGGANAINLGVNEWNGNTFACNNTNGHNTPSGDTDFTVMHKYGCLWLPTYKNSGTGSIKFYFDGVFVTSSEVTYSSGTFSPQASVHRNGNFMGLETGGPHQLQLAGGYQFPVNFDYVTVWQ